MAYLSNNMESKDLKTIEELSHTLDLHIDDNNRNFAEISVFIRRMEPMLKVFEDNEIVKMKIKRDTKSIVFYVSSISTIMVAVVGAYEVLKWIIIKIMLVR